MTWPAGNGEMTGRIRSHDWAATALGSSEAWSDRFKVAVEMMLASPLVSTLAVGKQRIILYNDAAASLYGARHPRALGLALPEIFPESYASVAGYYDSTFEGNSPTVHSIPLSVGNANSGEIFDAYLTPVRDADGTVFAAHMTGFEIGDRVRAEATLREREAELAQTHRIGQVASVDVALSGPLIGHRSPEYRRLHGLPPEQSREDHEDWVARVHVDDRDQAVAAFEAAIEAGDRYASEYRIVRPSDGEMRWISALGTIERDKDGHAVRLLGAHIDITERKRGEAALRESEARLRTLVGGIPQLVWRAGNGGVWTWASPQWTAYTGQGEDDSHELGWLEVVHPDDREVTLNAWSRATEEDAFQADYRLWHAEEQKYRWFRTRASPVTDEQGKVIEWLGTSTDVDQMRDLQERQRILVAELQHRVRNILTVIRSVFNRTAEAGDDLEDVVRHFQGRLDSLARTQVIVTRSADGTADLESLIRDELIGVTVGRDREPDIEGPDIALNFETAEMFGLAIHELTTNSLKYGALRFPTAKLKIAWHVNIVDTTRRTLVFTWAEQGVPMVDVLPSRTGFGRELIEKALPYRTGAATKLEFRGGGICCEISMPLPAGENADQGSQGKP